MKKKKEVDVQSYHEAVISVKKREGLSSNSKRRIANRPGRGSKQRFQRLWKETSESLKSPEQLQRHQWGTHSLKEDGH